MEGGGWSSEVLRPYIHGLRLRTNHIITSPWSLSTTGLAHYDIHCNVPRPTVISHHIGRNAEEVLFRNRSYGRKLQFWTPANSGPQLSALPSEQLKTCLQHLPIINECMIWNRQQKYLQIVCTFVYIMIILCFAERYLCLLKSWHAPKKILYACMCVCVRLCDPENCIAPLRCSSSWRRTECFRTLS